MEYMKYVRSTVAIKFSMWPSVENGCASPGLWHHSLGVIKSTMQSLPLQVVFKRSQ